MLTLAELEETRGENGWTEEPEEDGATDQLETGILSLCSKMHELLGERMAGQRNLRKIEPLISLKLRRLSLAY